MSKEIITRNIKENDLSKEYFSLDQKFFSKALSIAGRFGEKKKLLVNSWKEDRNGKWHYLYREQSLVGFSFSEDSLKILASDGENSLVFPIKEGVKQKEQNFVFVVDARLLNKVISSLPQGEIKCRFFQREKEDYFQIKTGNFTAAFSDLSSSSQTFLGLIKENIILPEKSRPNFSIPASDFLKACDKVIFAAATDEFYPVLNGVLFKAKDNQLTLAALDGYRLSKKIVDGIKLEEEVEAIVPKEILGRLRRLLTRVGKKNQELSLEVSINHKGGKALFSFLDFKVIAPLIEGKFPDYERIIPKEWATKITVETKELTKAVEGAALINNHPVGLDYKGQKLKVISRSSWDSEKKEWENKSDIEVKNAEVKGVGWKIAFNPDYLLDFLHSVKSKRISLEITDPLSVSVFRPLDDRSYLHLIKPIRIGKEEFW